MFNKQSLGFTKNRFKQLIQSKQKYKALRNTTSATMVLPPKWVDVLEETRDLISKVNQLSKEIDTLRKSKESAAKQQANEQQAQYKLDMALQIIRDIEDNLQKLGEKDCEDDVEQKMQHNAKVCLGISLNEVTPQLRQYQREMLRQLQIERPPSNREYQVQLQQNNQIENLEAQYLEQIILDRNDRIKGLGEKMKKMTELFKEMNRMVLEQGSLLDRIDFNIEQTHHIVSKGKKELIQANSRQETSSRAQKCICILVGLNILFIAVLILKYAF